MYAIRFTFRSCLYSIPHLSRFFRYKKRDSYGLRPSFYFRINLSISAGVSAKTSAPYAESSSRVRYPHSTAMCESPAAFAVRQSVSPSPTKTDSSGKAPSISRTSRTPAGSGLTGMPSRCPMTTSKRFPKYSDITAFVAESGLFESTASRTPSVF